MRLRTNFSFPFNSLVPWLMGAGWGAAVLGIFLAANLVSSAVRFNRENPGLKEELDGLRRNPPARSTAVPSPSAGELDELRGRLRGLNSLGAGSGKPVSSILSIVERLLPPDARLLSFQQEQPTGEIQLAVESSGLEGLSKFLTSLEGEKGFSKVELTKQSRVQEKSGSWIQFSIDLTEAAP